MTLNVRTPDTANPEPVPQSYSFADLFEAVVARVPDRTALVCGSTRRTFAQLDERADRLARWMADAGVERDDFVAVQLRNTTEHVETVLAAYKIRAVPINANYRYVADELRALYADAGVVGVVHEADARRLVEQAADGLHIAWTLEVGHAYERAVQATPATRSRSPRSSDDLYVIYTGGTTGRPKGVVWRMEDAFFACIGGGDPTGHLGAIADPAEILDRIVDSATFLAVPPLMHAAGMWPTLRWLLAGGRVVVLPEFDPSAVWHTVAEEQVTIMNIVADAMARPLLDELNLVDPATLRSLEVIGSGGAPLAGVLKEQLVDRLPWATVRDIYGSSETGVQGVSEHGAAGSSVGFRPSDSVILDGDAMREVHPGRVGIIARRDHVPLRYHRDPERTATTFREIEGRRYAVTGDLGRIDETGLVVLGRGAACINSGGEKIYPAEVEAALKTHPSVYDAMVVGEADERWGQRVVALVQPRPGGVVDEDELQRHCRSTLAGYKIPKRIVAVPQIKRSPAGKLDHAWANSFLRDEHDRRDGLVRDG